MRARAREPWISKDMFVFLPAPAIVYVSVLAHQPPDSCVSASCAECVSEEEEMEEEEEEEEAAASDDDHPAGQMDDV